MTVYTNDPAQTGLADGTVVTTGNSGGGLNTQFSAVNGSPTISTGHHSSVNTASYHCNASGSQASMKLPIASPTAGNAIRFPLEIVSNPSATQVLAQLGATGQNYIGVNSAGKMLVVLQGTIVHTSTSAPTAGAYWVEAWFGTSASANFHYMLYPDDGVYTPVDSYDTTSQNTGTTNPVSCSYGKQTTSGSWEVYVGPIAWQTSATTFIGLPAANTDPTANAGVDQSSIASGSVVTLNGTASSDPDGDPITYLWTQTAGTTVTLSDPTSATPTFTAPPTVSGETDTFSLVVTDNHGAASSPDSVNVGVVAGAASAPHFPVSPRDVTTIFNANTGSLVGTKPLNTANGDYLIAFVLERTTGGTITPPSGWTAVSGAGNTATLGTSGVWYKHIPDASAETVTTYTFSWSGTPRASLIICRAVGFDATTIIDAVGSFSALTGTSTITLPAVTAGATNRILVAVAMANTSTTTHPGPGAPAGAWQAIAQTDYDNGSSSSAVWVGYLSLTSSGSTGTKSVPVSPAAAGGSGGVMFTLNPAAVMLPNAGPDQPNVEPFATCTLDGSGSVPRPGHSLTYAWLQTDGPTVVLSSATAQKPTFTAPATIDGDTLTFQLVTNDGAADSNPDTVTIGVLPHTIWRLDAGGPTPIKASVL